MNDKLYINGELIELEENSIAQTFQINDLGELKDRQSNFTNVIKIPKTPRNIVAFKMLGIVGNTTRLPYEKLFVKYVSNDIELISDGKGIVLRTAQFYDLKIYDGNIDLSDTLGSKEIKNLDWVAYNHILSRSNYLSNINSTTGYIYSFADFIGGINVINIDEQIPSLFLHTIWHEIFTQNGLTYSGDIFTTLDFLNRLITPSKGYDNTIINGDLINIVSSSFSGNIDEFSSTAPINSIEVLTSGTFSGDSDFQIEIVGSVSVVSASFVSITFIVDGNPLFSKTLHTNESSDPTFNKIINTYQTNGTSYSLEIHTTTFEDETNNHETDVGYNVNTFKIGSLTKTIDIDFATMFTNETQFSFIKDVMQRYGLVQRKEKFSNNYEFKQIKNILNDTENVEDWSGKFIEEKTESYISNYAQINNALYKYDDLGNNIPQTFADGELTVDNVNLRKTGTLFSSIFKASNFAFGSNKYRDCKLWELDKDEVIKPIENGLRIFQKTSENRSVTYGWSDSVEKTTETLDIAYLDFTNQDYQSELDNNYSEFNDMLNDYNKKIIVCNLTLLDALTLDFFRLKYFAQNGGTFYMNRVINYLPHKKVSIELIKVKK